MRTEFYDEYVEVEDTHWWFRGRNVILPTLLRKYLRPPVKILDVGSGGGMIASSLLEFGSVTVCDVDPRCEAAVHERFGLEFRYGRAEALPFGDRSFDLVTAFDVIEHIEDDRLALRELVRVVRPGGGVAIAVPAYQWMWGRQDEVSGHYRRYNRRRLRELIEGAGLRIQRLTAFNTVLFLPAAAVRLFRGGVRPDTCNHEDGPIKSDFSMTPPGPVNSALAAMFAAERVPLRMIDLPFGISLFAFARKPGKSA
jgi:2-polyprenyl-3-methyl-5-hydroxy-6-metoxy-1,4-benzoquinol methylase